MNLKKTLYPLLLLVLMLTTFSSSAQYKSFFGDSLTEWYYVTTEVGFGSFTYPTVKISCDADTIVNSVLYKACRASRILPSHIVGEPLIYDTTDVFLLTEDTTLGLLTSRIQTDTLILDTICNLSLAPQDTFCYYQHGYPTPYSYCRYVDTIDYIGNNKRVRLGNLSFSFIEGVGSTFSMAQILYRPQLDNFDAYYGGEILGCHLKDGIVNYTDSLENSQFWNLNKIEDCIWYNFTAIQEQKMPIPISLYPNPSAGIFTIETSNLQTVTINVYNVSGQIILQKTINQNTTLIDLTAHPEGLYLLQLINEDQIITKRIVKY